jgi:hypothetical protein
MKQAPFQHRHGERGETIECDICMKRAFNHRPMGLPGCARHENLFAIPNRF